MNDRWIVAGKANHGDAKQLVSLLHRMGITAKLVDTKTWRSFRDQPAMLIVLLSRASLGDASYVEHLARLRTKTTGGVLTLRVYVDQCQDRVDELLSVIPDGPELDWNDEGALLSAIKHATASKSVDTVAGPPDRQRTQYLRWNDAPTRTSTIGRQAELDELTDLTGQDGAVHVLGIVGMGGVGKTALTVDLARRLVPSAEGLLWVTLRTRCTMAELEADLVGILGSDAPDPLGRTHADRVLNILRSRDLVLILDNFESLLEERSSRYIEGYEEYETLLRALAESQHNSRVIVTSREIPTPLDRLSSALPSVHVFRLPSVNLEVARALLNQHGLVGDADDLDQLAQRCDRNPLALQLASSYVLDVYGGDVAGFLHDATPVFGGIQALLEEHDRRLSSVERESLTWLALSAGPTLTEYLVSRLGSFYSRPRLLGALDQLTRKSLIWRADDGFDMHGLVRQYYVDSLVEACVSDFLTSTEASPLGRYLLVSPDAREYLRASQTANHVAPIIGGIRQVLRLSELRRRSTEILDQARNAHTKARPFLASNVVLLMAEAGLDLNNSDLHGLTFVSANFEGLDISGADLSGCLFRGCRFSDTFGSVTSVAFSSDGLTVAAGTFEGRLRTWQTDGFVPTMNEPAHRDWISGIAYAREGDSIVVGSFDGSMSTWNPVTHSMMERWEAHDGPVRAVTLSPDQDSIISVGEDGKVYQWDRGRREPQLLYTASDRLKAATAGGGLLAFGGDDRTIHILDMRRGELAHELVGHEGWIRALAMSEDVTHLVSGADDGTVRRWTIDDGTFEVLGSHSSRVWSVAADPTGHVIASGGTDGVIKIWDASTGEEVRQLIGHSSWGESSSD